MYDFVCLGLCSTYTKNCERWFWKHFSGLLWYTEKCISVNLLWNNGMCSGCKSWCTLKLSSFDFNATRSQIEQIPLLHYIIQFESPFWVFIEPCEQPKDPDTAKWRPHWECIMPFEALRALGRPDRGLVLRWNYFI